ncbi:hypothetical protein GCM10012287_27390 [Streptomyces daqingensis]|uniref:Uncharacterized protein n=1 Tax=Streptomyces daqingensis TaxID=1472640 RepID=A0ABQ2MD80_9ACTN|nr:hypothetical protein GCM10012287_27390 [Streptomyces daqingensis]
MTPFPAPPVLLGGASQYCLRVRQLHGSASRRIRLSFAVLSRVSGRDVRLASAVPGFRSPAGAAGAAGAAGVMGSGRAGG